PLRASVILKARTVLIRSGFLPSACWVSCRSCHSPPAPPQRPERYGTFAEKYRRGRSPFLSGRQRCLPTGRSASQTEGCVPCAPPTHGAVRWQGCARRAYPVDGENLRPILPGAEGCRERLRTSEG